MFPNDLHVRVVGPSTARGVLPKERSHVSSTVLHQRDPSPSRWMTIKCYTYPCSRIDQIGRTRHLHASGDRTGGSKSRTEGRLSAKA